MNDMFNTARHRSIVTTEGFFSFLKNKDKEFDSLSPEQKEEIELFKTNYSNFLNKEVGGMIQSLKSLIEKHKNALTLYLEDFDTGVSNVIDSEVVRAAKIYQKTLINPSKNPFKYSDPNFQISVGTKYGEYNRDDIPELSESSSYEGIPIDILKKSKNVMNMDKALKDLKALGKSIKKNITKKLTNSVEVIFEIGIDDNAYGGFDYSGKLIDAYKYMNNDTYDTVFVSIGMKRKV